MIISRKSPTFLASLPPLCLNNSQLDLVTSFKYLGIIISSNLSWSLQSSPFVLKLNKSLVLSIALSISVHLLKLFLLCIVPLFSPISPTAPLSGIPPKIRSTLHFSKKTQLIALRMCSNNWSSDYYSLLSSHNISPLSTHRSIFKLCLVYKISNKFIYFPLIALFLNLFVHIAPVIMTASCTLFLFHVLHPLKIHLFLLPFHSGIYFPTA